MYIIKTNYIYASLVLAVSVYQCLQECLQYTTWLKVDIAIMLIVIHLNSAPVVRDVYKLSDVHN